MEKKTKKQENNKVNTDYNILWQVLVFHGVRLRPADSAYYTLIHEFRSTSTRTCGDGGRKKTENGSRQKITSRRRVY